MDRESSNSLSFEGEVEKKVRQFLRSKSYEQIHSFQIKNHMQPQRYVLSKSGL
jgi:DNA-dependent RNA polymerase auxiliary subunit epsilon